MARHRVPIWVVLFLCFLAIIAVMTTSGFWSRRDYQTFYVDFASEYSLLIRMIEVKDDVDGMYMAAWSLRTGGGPATPPFEAEL
jgi:hypothetical protein